jgi:hypothetical protein
MEKKVDKLINLIEVNFNQLDNPLFKEVIFRLKNKDLLAFDILDYIFHNSIIKDENLLSSITNHSENLKSQLIQPLSSSEELFLNLSYNKFYDLQTEIYNSSFWEQSPIYRLGRISQLFSIYGEILNYKPIKDVLEQIAEKRPPMESEISGPLFKFIRNILVHFPIFDSWEEIWVNKDLINWNKTDQSIDKFLEKFKGCKSVKYRYKERNKVNFNYATVNFPEAYDNEKIYLKDIISEKDGVKFATAMMLRVINTQVISIK